MDKMQEAFSNYFGTEENKSDVIPNILTTTTDKESVREAQEEKEFQETYNPLIADGNIDSLEQLCDLLKQLLNAAWGNDWGEISPDLKTGEDSAKIILPQITVDINNREIAEKCPLKPVLMSTVKESLNGKETGDCFLVYRQWFDCVIEFNFYGRSSKDARQLQAKFESLLAVYTGYLKRKGISEFLFLKEVSAKSSLNFTEQTPMKCMMCFVRFERILPIRQSLINKINTDIGIKKVNNEKIKMIIEKNQKQINQEEGEVLDLFDSFFEGGTGVKYEDI